jgi:hypothetical protein
MKHIYEISDQKNLIQIVQQEYYSFCDFKSLVEAIIQDPRYKPEYNVLIDLRGIKYTPVVRDMMVLSEYMSNLIEHYKGSTAIITHNCTHHYLLKLATIQAGKNGFKSRIFCEPEYAQLWLNDIST